MWPVFRNPLARTVRGARAIVPLVRFSWAATGGANSWHNQPQFRTIPSIRAGGSCRADNELQSDPPSSPAERSQPSPVRNCNAIAISVVLWVSWSTALNNKAVDHAGTTPCPARTAAQPDPAAKPAGRPSGRPPRARHDATGAATNQPSRAAVSESTGTEVDRSKH